MANDNQDEELKNDKLLDAMAVFREEQNEVTEHNFIQALIDAVFVAPVNFSKQPVITDDGDVDIPDDAQMQLITFELENGNGVFPVFTDLDAYNAHPIEADLPVYPWAMALSDYLPILQEDSAQNIEGLALNPFTNGMPITRDNITYIAQQVAESVEHQEANASEDSGDSEMEISSAEEIIPTPLRYDLIGIADDAMGVIESMYLLWLTNKDSQTANYLLVIDGPNRDDVQALYQKIATTFEEKSGDEGSAVDIVFADDFQVDLSEFDSLYNRNLE